MRGSPQIVLRDIVTASDRAAARRVRRGPGQDRFVGSVAESFEDAIRDARAMPRYWTVHHGDEVVGFAMISDGIPSETLAGATDLVGPYYLWRLLIDVDQQRRGYGTATLDAIVEYLQDRPGADVLYTSAAQGEGTPQPFYERYGFVPTGQVLDDEVVLALDLRER